jgi:hypothetical protein
MQSDQAAGLLPAEDAKHFGIRCQVPNVVIAKATLRTLEAQRWHGVLHLGLR